MEMMLKTLLLAGLGIGVGVAAVKVIPPLTVQHNVQQLLETRECVDCNLKEANLQGVDLQGANLQGANLAAANLSETRLENANLQNANLRGATLKNADLGCAAITFNLESDDQSAGVNVDVDEIPQQTEAGNFFGFSLNTSGKGATLSYNLQGCANFQGADLQGTQMPSGTIHP